MNEARRIEIALFGESYSVVSDEPIEKVELLARELDDLMRLIARKTGLTDVKKIAVLTALKLATSQAEARESNLVLSRRIEHLLSVVGQGLVI